MENIKNKFELVYKTSTTPFFPICLIGAPYGEEFGKVFGVKHQQHKIIVLIIDGNVNWFFPEEIKPIAKKVIDKIYRSPRALETIKKNEQKFSEELIEEIKKDLPELPRVFISSITGQGISTVKDMIWKVLNY